MTVENSDFGKVPNRLARRAVEQKPAAMAPKASPAKRKAG